MSWQAAVLLAVVVAALVVDLKTGYIPKWLTVPLFCGGLIMGYVQSGWAGVGWAVAAGVLVFTSTFAFNTPGGGDFKLALAVGAWMGINWWAPYFVGMALSHLVLGLAIRFKVYGPSPVQTASGIWMELRTWQVPDLGEKNFRLLQAPRERITGDTEKIAAPGAIYIVAGAVAAVLAGF